jgi:hypothetical protein
MAALSGGPNGSRGVPEWLIQINAVARLPENKWRMARRFTWDHLPAVLPFWRQHEGRGYRQSSSRYCRTRLAIDILQSWRR